LTLGQTAWEILSGVLLPLMLAAGVGWALGRWARGIEAQTLSRLTFYVLTPCLTFSSLATSSLKGAEVGQIALFVLANTVVLAALALAVTRTMRLSRSWASAFLLTVLFVNSGNYGIPVNLFAFGEGGLERAVTYLVVSSILVNTVGVFLASQGRGGGMEPLRNTLRAPLPYAAMLALGVNLAHWQVPFPLLRVTETLGRAAVPCMLLLLGMQLARVTRAGNQWPLIGLASFIRLGLAPVVAWLIASVMGLSGLTRQVCLVEASMPTAVATTILATEFGAEPRFVSGTVFLSTLASVFTLTVLLLLLKAP